MTLFKYFSQTFGEGDGIHHTYPVGVASPGLIPHDVSDVGAGCVVFVASPFLVRGDDRGHLVHFDHDKKEFAS